jgi:hypothetical protein
MFKSQNRSAVADATVIPATYLRVTVRAELARAVSNSGAIAESGKDW